MAGDRNLDGPRAGVGDRGCLGVCTAVDGSEPIPKDVADRNPAGDADLDGAFSLVPALVDAACISFSSLAPFEFDPDPAPTANCAAVGRAPSWLPRKLKLFRRPVNPLNAESARCAADAL